MLKLQKFTMGFIAFVFLLSFSTVVISEREAYYRWVGDDGVVHYGSRPPEGVNAVKVDTWGSASAPAPAATKQSSSRKAAAQSGPMNEEQKKILAERQQQCEQEKGRLAALRSPGRRIKMEQGDGSARYLSPEEIASEISTSEEFVSQACQ